MWDLSLVILCAVMIFEGWAKYQNCSWRCKMLEALLNDQNLEPDSRSTLMLEINEKYSRNHSRISGMSTMIIVANFIVSILIPMLK